MIPPQTIPSSFTKYTEHIYFLLHTTTQKPCAWFISSKSSLTPLFSTKDHGHIEDLEFQILHRGRIAFLQYAVTLGPTQQPHCVVALFNGIQFTHTIFIPHDTPTNWWIEEWTITHLLWTRVQRCQTSQNQTHHVCTKRFTVTHIKTIISYKRTIKVAKHP